MWFREEIGLDKPKQVSMMFSELSLNSLGKPFVQL